MEKIKCAGGEYLGEVLMGLFTILFGMALAFYLNWIMPFAIFIILPLYIVAYTGEAKDYKARGMRVNVNVVEKVNDDSIMMSETSVNWMTTQTLENNELIIEKYKEIV